MSPLRGTRELQRVYRGRIAFRVTVGTGPSGRQGPLEGS